MVFQGEDVPLTEDVIKKAPREFFPTFMEWVADGNAEQVMAEGVGSPNATIYTVPNNFTFFLTSASLSGFSDAVGNAHGFVQLINGENEKVILAAAIDHIANSPYGGNISQSFVMPLKFAAGSTIKTTASIASTDVLAAIQGFLLPKKISIR